MSSTPNRSVAELEAALVARDELIAVMGHELRNAMSPLVLLAEQLQLLPSADDLMKKRVALLSRTLRTFRDTVDRVGEVSGLRAGKLVLELDEVDAAAVASTVCDQLAERAAAGGCELHRDFTPVIGRWDRSRLAQIIQHLVGNAIRYAPGTPIEIGITERDNALHLVVQDHGGGIPVADREHLFDRFDHPSSRRSSGLGIGLWVVKTLCSAMGGTIELVESEHGARFCMTLPRG